MEYLLLIYTPTDRPAREDADAEAMFAEFGRYTQAIQEAGAMVGGDPLQPPDMATTVRLEDGELLTTDGPFAETKEWLGGYYKIDVDTLDEALEWAGRVPSVRYGDRIEVRPVMPLPADYASSS